MKFSIIVPVYNVEKYLKKCVLSLINQNYMDYEIILIDDGSTDKSGIICDEFAKKYENIRVYHKENGGLSDARNYGLSKAKGMYIMFVDSDDWIKEEILPIFEKIIRNNEFEVIETRFIEVYNNFTKICDSNLQKYFEKNLDTERAIEWILNKSDNTWPAPKRIYLRKFLLENKIQFLKGRLHEDIDWTCNVLYNAKKYGICDIPWYYHRMQREGSITNSIKAKNIIDVIKIATIHYDIYMKEPDKLHKKIINRLMISVYGKIKQSIYCSDADCIKIKQTIRDNKRIFNICPKLRYRWFVLTMKVVGINNTIRLLRLFKKK